MELMFAEWEDGERFSFEDSDRFEEDSLCSFISEAESLCQNWRGWRKQSAGPNSPTGGGGGGGSGGTRMRGEDERGKAAGGGKQANPAWALPGSCPDRELSQAESRLLDSLFWPSRAGGGIFTVERQDRRGEKRGERGKEGKMGREGERGGRERKRENPRALICARSRKLVLWQRTSWVGQKDLLLFLYALESEYGKISLLCFKNI